MRLLKQLIMITGLGGCLVRLDVQCIEDANCDLGPGGVCQVNSSTGHQWCSYPDTGCQSGYRYSDLDVGDGVSGSCVSPKQPPGGGVKPSCDQLIAFERPDGIYVMRPDGSGLHGVSSVAGDHRPVWSPDGRRLLFVRPMGSMDDIFVVNVDGTGLVNLTNSPDAEDDMPAWSPDGSQIAYVTSSYSTSGDVDLAIMDADGRHSRRLDFRVNHASWALSGSTIVYSSYTSDLGSQIYSINRDGSGIKDLTNNTFVEMDPKISPDGQHILFTSDRDHTGAIAYVMDLDGSNQHRIVAFPNGFAPVWAPSGMAIAFESVATGGKLDVFRADLDGTHVVNLTDGVPQDDELGSWSADGLHLVITSAREGISEIYRIDADGGHPLRLTLSDVSSASKPVWVPCP